MKSFWHNSEMKNCFLATKPQAQGHGELRQLFLEKPEGRKKREGDTATPTEALIFADTEQASLVAQ